ncbi:MAG: S8 family serine peptidase [Bacteroidia bacterium]|nr:S8 family serine peptidase [Bacteroidia bacterium]
MMKALFLFFTAILFSLNGWSQTEVNLKLLPGKTDLESFFTEKTGVILQKEDISPTLALKYNFLPDLRKVSPLVKGKTAHPEIGGIFTLQLRGDDVRAEINRLLQSGDFVYVEENRKVALDRATYTPDDDSLARQWFHTAIRSYQAWDITRGRSDVRIGVLDTGLDFDHPEFEGQVYINAAEDINGNGRFDPWPSSEVRGGVSGDFDGLDNDQNAFVDDVAGYDFTDQPRSPFGGDYLFEDPFPQDENSHGTVVSGIIAAKGDNQVGGSGVAPDCKLVVLRAFAGNGSGEDDDIARAIIYAADNGIKILNFSFGDIYPSLTMHAAIKYAYEKGVIMVSSAGNGTGDDLHYPSGFDEVISVSASDRDAGGREYLWPLSSYGLTVDLCAPGSRIFTTTMLDTASDGTVTAFTTTQGTSTSAPMVSAAVGLLFAKNGYRTPQQVRGLLTTTTDDISDEGWDHLTGAGRLNLEKLLQVVGSSVVKITAPVNDGGSPRDTVFVTGTVLDPEFLRYHIEWQYGIEDKNPWHSIVSDQEYQLKDDTLAFWDLSDIPSDLDTQGFPANWDGQSLPEGDYTIRIRVERTDGFTTEDRIRFVRDKTPPETRIVRAASVWDNHEKKFLVIFRSSDQGYHTLYYRRTGNAVYQKEVFDRTTRNGEFLLGVPEISNGTYEFFIEAQNLAGLVSQTVPATFSFQPGYINRSGFTELDYSLPMGRFLNETYDFDNDGLKEVVLNEYKPSLSFGQLMLYEFNGSFFIKADSLSFKPVLIPKDIADADGDGLLELLSSVNDSSYITEQKNTGLFPKEIIYSNLGDSLRAEGFADTDGDNQLELLLKDDVDFYVYERSGNTWSKSADLRDLTPDYMGGISPRAISGDFDRDGKAEVIYGDFDGDIIIYEHVSGNTYKDIFRNLTDLTKSGVYLTKGDFDGDGFPEFFVAAHTSSLKNSDIEYDTPHWWLRIFKSFENDSFEVVWEDFIYDIDTETYNAATAGNLDTDVADELVFTTFPRTYILDYNGSEYHWQWFYYGSLATHHIIGDFNGNGVQEVGIGRGDTTFFYEKNVLYTGPTPVGSLRGVVTGTTDIRLDWNPSANATGYEIWRVKDPLNNDTATVLGPLTGVSFTDANLEEDELYLYVLRSVNPALNPSVSGFGNAFLLRPHAAPVIDSIKTSGSNQLEIWFSQEMEDRDTDKSRFVVNGKMTPVSIIRAGDYGKRLILTFTANFIEGVNTLKIDSTFTDAELAYIAPNSRERSFFYEKTEEESLYLTHWEAIGDKEGVLYFNFPLEETQALDSVNYTLSPVGTLSKIEWASDDQDAVKITLKDARFGALGYPLSVKVENICAINLICIGEEGNVATFSSHKEDLSEAFVYPNPAYPHELFEGVRFANLTKQATIEVFTVSGRFVNRLEETDGDGGYEWDLRDKTKMRIKPGVYIYHIYTDLEGVEDFIGKFSVVE